MARLSRASAGPGCAGVSRSGRILGQGHHTEGGDEPVITGMHSIVYASDADAARAFFRDVLGLPW